MRSATRTFTLLAAAWASSLYGQPNVRDYRAAITGGPLNEGKCNIEVNVDDVALVEVSGDRGRLVTVSGQPSEWRRMVCTAPIPADPLEFRFRGIDGRGRIFLEREPRGNRGVAVVRIEDPKGGREGYTFELIWRGIASPVPPPFYPERERERERDRDRDRDRDRGGRRDVVVVTCASFEGRRTFCEANTRNGVILLRRLGERDCREGETWGFDRRGIWVDRGCRAEFEVAR
jgi:hypothetical protein